MLTHDNLLWNVINHHSAHRLRETDRTVTVAPLFLRRRPRRFAAAGSSTGDLGRMDAEDFITLVDRKKDMIITGGENVYPIEVEQVLYRASRRSARWPWSACPTPSGARRRSPSSPSRIGVRSDRCRRADRLRPRAPGPLQMPDSASSTCPELPRNATGQVLETDAAQGLRRPETAVQR